MMQLLIMLPNNDGIMVTFLVCFWFTLARRRSPDYERRAVAGDGLGHAFCQIMLRALLCVEATQNFSLMMLVIDND